MQSYEDYQREDALWRLRIATISKFFHQLEGAKPCRMIRFTDSSESHAEALVDCAGKKILVTARLLP